VHKFFKLKIPSRPGPFFLRPLPYLQGSIGLCAGAGAAEVDHELIVARYKGKEHVETAHLFLEQPADEIFLTKLRTEIRRQVCFSLGVNFWSLVRRHVQTYPQSWLSRSC
jgi:hypothetical protein